MKLVKWCVELLKVPPVVIDGALYVGIAVFGTMTAILTSDEVWKFMPPYWVFYLKAFSNIGLAACSALKMFRSNTYADHVAAKERNGQITKTESVSTVTTVASSTETPKQP